MIRKKDTGLLLKISHDGRTIHVVHKFIEEDTARIRIREMAMDGIDAKYFPEKTIGEFREVIGRLNESLKRQRQPTIRVLQKAV